VEKGPTAVSIGRGTVALYSILSKGYRAFFFFREHTIYLGAGRKGADLQRVTGGEGWGWGAFQILFKPSEPSLSWDAVISKGLCTDLMERVFIYLYL